MHAFTGTNPYYEDPMRVAIDLVAENRPSKFGKGVRRGERYPFLLSSDGSDVIPCVSTRLWRGFGAFGPLCLRCCKSVAFVVTDLLFFLLLHILNLDFDR